LLILDNKRVQLVLVNLKHLTVFVVIILINQLAILIKLRGVVTFLEPFRDFHLLFVLIFILVFRLNFDLLLHSFDARVFLVIILLIIVVLVDIWLIIRIFHLLVTVFFDDIVFLLHLIVHHLLLVVILLVVFTFFLTFALIFSVLGCTLLHLISKRKRVRCREIGSRKVESVVIFS
jgi:hypothetical protein